MDDLYIGLMSGTSIDGIDAALVDLSNNKFKLLGTLYQPYPDAIKTSLGVVIREKKISLADLTTLDNELAILNAQTVNTLIRNTDQDSGDITAIGYHGQTVFHEPDGKHPNSLQLGDPNILLEHTGISVVADFRRMDMAVGGQGAPLVPAFHQFLFQNSLQTHSQNRAILNIGGIANLTILSADAKQPITGFDTGPGNCLLDEWIQLQRNQAFDKDGQWAEQGKLDTNILQNLLDDPYFTKAPPKSSGREYFHLDWLLNGKKIDPASLPAQDMQTTLTFLTAKSITNALKEHAANTQQVFVCGGGAHNDFLMSVIQQQLAEIRLTTTAELGLDPDWVEASAFAWLAQQRIEQRTANIISVTGAQKPVVLGALYTNGNN